MAGFKKHPDKEGWYTLDEMDHSNTYSDPPQPPEFYTLAVTPTGRLCDYPGGPMRGQLSRQEFSDLKKTLKASTSVTAKHISADVIKADVIKGGSITGSPIQKEKKPVATKIATYTLPPNNGVKVTVNVIKIA